MQESVGVQLLQGGRAVSCTDNMWRSLCLPHTTLCSCKADSQMSLKL